MTKGTLKIPKVTFVDSPKLRANYLCFLARQISGNFYQTHGYLVLPKFVPDGRTVFFPDLNYKKSFWRKIKSTKPESVATLYSETLLGEVEKQTVTLSASPNRAPEWSKISQKFWSALTATHLFDRELAKVRSITMQPTTFGTGSSFSFNPKGKAEIFITLRSDSHISSVGSSIIKCLLMIGNEKYRGNFVARQEITNFLFEKTKLMKFTGTNESKSLSPKLLTESRQYLARLGFTTKNPFVKKSGEILINGKLAKNYLSPQELRLLTLFFQNRGKTVTHDQIAQTIWGDDFEQKFSLWAITKLKQKLNKKLEELRVKNAIFTVQTRGYSLA